MILIKWQYVHGVHSKVKVKGGKFNKYKKCRLRRMSQRELHISGWIGWDWKSPGGVKYRAADVANNAVLHGCLTVS